jgi:hypothetical protein
MDSAMFFKDIRVFININSVILFWSANDQGSHEHLFLSIGGNKVRTR